jgi:hypothetical protein
MTTVAGPLTADEFASMWQIGLRSDDMGRDRSIQSADGITGVSDIGICRERTRRNLTGVERTDPDSSSAATIGTYIHAGALVAYQKSFPHVLIEHSVTVTLPSGAVIPGNGDIIDPDEPSATDLKTVDGIEYVRKHGPTDQQRIQRTLYALGAWQAGLFGDIPIESVICRNVWVDRSGGTDEVIVDQEPFNWHWVEEAEAWLSDVRYAVTNGEEASKDKPIPFCSTCCPFYTGCRGSDIPPAVITDPEIVLAAKTYREALDAQNAAEKLKKEAAKRLDGVEGQCGDLHVKHIYVGPSHVEFDRAASYRIDVKPLKTKGQT